MGIKKSALGALHVLLDIYKNLQVEMSHLSRRTNTSETCSILQRLQSTQREEEAITLHQQMGIASLTSVLQEQASKQVVS